MKSCVNCQYWNRQVRDIGECLYFASLVQFPIVKSENDSTPKKTNVYTTEENYCGNHFLKENL